MSNAPQPPEAPDDRELLLKLRSTRDRMFAEIGKVIIGQRRVLDELTTALFCGGHAIVIGVPGLAKTLMVRTIAAILHLSFNRIQFTPDLMPSDITGSELVEEDPATGRRLFRFVRGPVFSNIILADEINRTPPKTQAALLQAMEEKQVTFAGETYPIEEPFFVLATQNPIEQEGTYPLPEAQLDRFMFNIYIDYPDIPEEIEIVEKTTAAAPPPLQPILGADDILALRQVIRRVPVSREIVDYAVRLVASTRPGRLGASLPFVQRFVRWGAGPRAGQYLILGAKTIAALRGAPCVDFEDVRRIAPAVLRHRIITNFHAESEGVRPVDIVQRLLEEKQLPQS
jgi:MoxR-like ATPase